MKILFVSLLITACSPMYTVRVISESDQNNKHCIENKRIICEYKTPGN